MAIASIERALAAGPTYDYNDFPSRDDIRRLLKLNAAQAERIKRLEAACRRQVANIEHWLETGEPAGREESKSIYAQLKAALRAVEG